MPARSFVRKVVIRLILLDRSAKSYAALHAGVRGIGDSAERIHSLELPIAQVSEHVAVKFV